MEVTIPSFCIRYESFGGITLAPHDLIQAIKDHFKDDIVMICVNGYSNMLILPMKRICKSIRQDTDNQDKSFERYSKWINSEHAFQFTSDTLRQLLNILSPGLGDSLKGLMICSIVNEHLSGIPAPFQMALGIYLRGKKEIHKAVILICSYDEMRRF